MRADRKKSQRIIRRLKNQNFHISGNDFNANQKREPPKVPRLAMGEKRLFRGSNPATIENTLNPVSRDSFDLRFYQLSSERKEDVRLINSRVKADNM